MYDRLFFCICSLLLFFNSSAQEIRVQGGFVQDGMKLGENVQYWMSARYPMEAELFLPDSSYNFSPFEFAAKRYYESRIRNGMIIDTAVYTLQSYEIDKVQYLQLPAFLLKNGDTTLIRAKLDSILLFELVKEVSDTTKLKENLAYQDVPTQFNYPLFWIIMGVVLVLSLLIYVLFGARIRKAFKLRRLRRDYEAFSARLNGYIHSLQSEPKSEIAEKAIADWKMFLERLEDKPYTRLTTKEIVALEYTTELTQTLQSIDRSVYGNIQNENIYKDFQAVEDFTQHRYSMIKDQIKNG